ncbi:H(+)/Cl(-) exchange transporter 7-like isoform X2 [Cimex lectularius]|nr:H(+)/Cl(-) exchange transporter 7-like isoform X2 [Cimex lectularius]XP_014252354.1 H(+)/Cl(-) exchange transporter 7-like isoform X2 [Cimex lectularius]
MASPDLQTQESVLSVMLINKEEPSYDTLHLPKPEINSLNFDYPFASKFFLKQESETSETKRLYLKWIVLFLITIIVPSTFLILEISIGEFMALKIKIMSLLLKNGKVVPAVMFWWLVNLSLALLSGSLVIFLEPTGEGSGLPEILGFLNGVDVPNLCSSMSFIVRSLATFLMVMANLPGGLQEPFLLIGVIFGGLIYKIGIKKFRPFYTFEWDIDRRNFAAAGLAASTATVFGTPLGGLMFAMEHLSHWRGEIIFLFMATGTIASFISVCTYYYYRGMKDGEFHPINIFSPLREDSIFVDFVEIPMYFLIGIIGGLSGACWTLFQSILIRIRYRFLKNKWLRLADIAVVTSIISLSGILFYIALDKSANCMDDKLAEREKYTLLKEFNPHCTGNASYASMSTLMFQDPAYITRTLFTVKKDQYSPHVLVVFLCQFYLWSLLHCGTFMPSGIILPNLIIGAVWGRILSMVLTHLSFIKDSYKKPIKLAYLCAVAQTSGVTKMGLGLTIIMIEASGTINFVIPVMIIVIVSRFLSKLFGSSIIKTIALVKGYIMLSNSPIPLWVDMSVENIMNRKMVCLPSIVSTENIKKILETYLHLAFPIADSGGSISPMEGPISIKGMILRKQLLALINPTAYATKRSVLLTSNKPIEITVPMSTQFNLEEYLNPTPFTIYRTASLTRACSIFTALALHTLIVVDENMQAVGLITRRDLILAKKGVHWGIF